MALGSHPALPLTPSMPSHKTLTALNEASTLNLPEKPNTSLLRPKESRPSDTSSLSSPIIASPSGDVILKYTKPSSGESYYWKVDSRMLKKNSPYFQVVLDPTKTFIEGQLLAQQLAETSGSNSLPILTLPATQHTELYGVEALELFLQILCSESLASDDEEEGLETVFSFNLKAQPLSLIARLVEFADYYNSSRHVAHTLNRLNYTVSKTSARLDYTPGSLGKSRLHRFSEKSLNMSEDRIRQACFVANFLGQEDIAQIMTHTLVVAGSRRWFHSPEMPESPYLRWQHLANGVEGMAQLCCTVNLPEDKKESG